MMGNHRSALDEVIAYQNMCKAHQVGFLPRSASHNIVDQTRDKTLEIISYELSALEQIIIFSHVGYWCNWKKHRNLLTHFGINMNRNSASAYNRENLKRSSNW